MMHYDYYKPKSLAEAWELAGRIQGALLVAGGTDMMVRIKNRAVRPKALVSLRSIPELAGIEVGAETRIGPTTTITDLIAHRDLAATYPLLVAAARRMGSVQVRNAGTVGGNICNASPCADAALALLVLDARARLCTRTAERDVALADFFVGPKQTCVRPAEILTDILVPEPAAGLKTAFFKKGRVKLDLAVASVAVALELDGDTCKKARVGTGSCAPTSLRLVSVERLLEGKKITREVAAEAARLGRDSVSPICDVRSTDEYRRQVVGVYIERALEQIMGWKKP